MILIVEDDERLTRILSRSFREQGWRFQVAQNGVDAYSMIREEGLKCILLDIRMPMIDGMEFLSILKKQKISVPTIIMTGDPTFNTDKLHDFPNVVGFLAKPFSIPDLVEMIKEHIA